MNERSAEFERFKDQKELWVNSRMITAEVSLNLAAVKKILPFGLSLTKEAKGTFFIVDYRKPNFTAPYIEAALLVHVKTLFGRGLHCVWMTVDDDTALIYGRELLGYPKKMAQMKFEETETQARASVTRRGIEVLTMQAEIGLERPKTPIFDKKMFNVGGIGNATIFQTIWLSRSVERIVESYEAKVTLNITPSKADPLSKLVESFETSCGQFAVFDIVKGRYLLPAGLAGPGWYMKTQALRVK